jgi:hypothetical protein
MKGLVRIQSKSCATFAHDFSFKNRAPPLFFENSAKVHGKKQEKREAQNSQTQNNI